MNQQYCALLLCINLPSQWRMDTLIDLSEWGTSTCEYAVETESGPESDLNQAPNT